MKRRFMALSALLVLLAGSALAGPPMSGSYNSTDIGGLAFVGRYTEGWDAGAGALEPGTTLNAMSWDGMTLGTQWHYWCATEGAAPVLLTNTVNAQGNGNRTYMKTFVGGYIWLSGTGPWAGGDVDYPGVINNYVEFETITYQNWVPIAAVTNVQATASFDSYPDMCMAFYIGNGNRVATTDLAQPIPANYPPLLDPGCDATRGEGAAWDFDSITLTIDGCAVSIQESTWGAVKALYGD